MAGIFDKVVGELQKGVNSVSESSKFYVEKARLNTQIQNIEKERKQRIEGLGIMVYNMHSNGGIDIEQCGKACEEIDQMGLKINEIQGQLIALENERAQQIELARQQAEAARQQAEFARQQAEATRQAEFARQQAEATRQAEAAQSSGAAAPPADGIKCACGYVNRAGSKFCANCGKPVSQASE